MEGPKRFVYLEESKTQNIGPKFAFSEKFELDKVLKFVVEQLKIRKNDP